MALSDYELRKKIAETIKERTGVDLPAETYVSIQFNFKRGGEAAFEAIAAAAYQVPRKVWHERKDTNTVKLFRQAEFGAGNIGGAMVLLFMEGAEIANPFKQPEPEPEPEAARAEATEATEATETEKLGDAVLTKAAERLIASSEVAPDAHRLVHSA